MKAIDDYINGNLTDAKKRARKAGRKSLTRVLREEYGYSERQTNLIVAYLLDVGSFQAAADAERLEREETP